MLTHDFDPIVDMIYHLPHKFAPVPKAYFLENVGGLLIEKEIKKKDIKTYLEIAKENIASLDEDINKLIYLRRNMELINDKSEVYQLLSNLFKKRESPVFIANGEPRMMSSEEVTSATVKISKYVSGFDYKNFYDLVNNTLNMISLYYKATNNYEKLQIYRIINIENSDNDIIRKFVNETFHIENDYVYQLNPCNYQTVPHYIIEECTKDIEMLRERIHVTTSNELSPLV